VRIAQVRCFKKWKKTRNVLSLIYLEIYLVVDVMHGIKKVKILAYKLSKFPSKKKKKKKKAILSFYWDRDMAGKSIKAKDYKNNNFEKARESILS